MIPGHPGGRPTGSTAPTWTTDWKSATKSQKPTSFPHFFLHLLAAVPDVNSNCCIGCSMEVGGWGVSSLNTIPTRETSRPRHVRIIVLFNYYFFHIELSTGWSIRIGEILEGAIEKREVEVTNFVRLLNLFVSHSSCQISTFQPTADQFLTLEAGHRLF